MAPFVYVCIEARLSGIGLMIKRHGRVLDDESAASLLRPDFTKDTSDRSQSMETPIF